MTPMMQALLVVVIFCAIVAAFGFYWAKREREEWRARHRR
jgi:hypothetical protein